MELRTLQEQAFADAREGKVSKLSRRWKNTDIEQRWHCDNGDEVRVYDTGGGEMKYAFVR